MNDLEKLSPRDLDKQVAECLFGWIGWLKDDFGDRVGLMGTPSNTTGIKDCPHYSTDDNAVRLVRDRIAELGLAWEFSIQVNALIPGIVTDFLLLQATPRAQCIAALMAQASQTAGSTKGE